MRSHQDRNSSVVPGNPNSTSACQPEWLTRWRALPGTANGEQLYAHIGQDVIDVRRRRVQGCLERRQVLRQRASRHVTQLAQIALRTAKSRQSAVDCTGRAGLRMGCAPGDLGVFDGKYVDALADYVERLPDLVCWAARRRTTKHDDNERKRDKHNGADDYRQIAPPYRG